MSETFWRQLHCCWFYWDIMRVRTEHDHYNKDFYYYFAPPFLRGWVSWEVRLVVKRNSASQRCHTWWAGVASTAAALPSAIRLFQQKLVLLDKHNIKKRYIYYCVVLNVPLPFALFLFKIAHFCQKMLLLHGILCFPHWWVIRHGGDKKGYGCHGVPGSCP